jgi:biopolymer transport protein ExbD
MRFFLRKRKQTPTVIIIALIDVLIVMLIFLMTTTTFKQHPALRLALPQSSQAQNAGAADKTPLVVTVDLAGDFRFGSDPRPISAEDLAQRLSIEATKNPEVTLAIRADEGAPFGRIVRIMDASKAAGIQTVNAFTRKPAQP